MESDDDDNGRQSILTNDSLHGEWWWWQPWPKLCSSLNQLNIIIMRRWHDLLLTMMISYIGFGIPSSYRKFLVPFLCRNINRFFFVDYSIVSLINFFSCMILTFVAYSYLGISPIPVASLLWNGVILSRCYCWNEYCCSYCGGPQYISRNLKIKLYRLRKIQNWSAKKSKNLCLY